MTGPSQIPSIGDGRRDGQYPWKGYMSSPRDASVLYFHIGEKKKTPFCSNSQMVDRIALLNSESCS